MRAGESAPLINPLTASSPQFFLDGGKYWFAVVGGAFNAGTVSLQRVSPNGLDLVTVGAAAALTVAGGGVFDLPPGAYQVTLSTTGMVIYAEVVRINEE